MKKLLPLSLLFFFFSCVTKKQYAHKELEISILKKQLDSIYTNGLVDNDGDGIIDKIDSCPAIKGDLTANGCPDTDNDGIADLYDKCPTIQGPKENEGCPWQDSDGDFVLDKDDKCPTVQGSKESDGCPEVSSPLEYLIEFCCSNHKPGHCATKMHEMKDLFVQYKCIFK